MEFNGVHIAVYATPPSSPCHAHRLPVCSALSKYMTALGAAPFEATMWMDGRVCVDHAWQFAGKLSNHGINAVPVAHRAGVDLNGWFGLLHAACATTNRIHENKTKQNIKVLV